MRLPLKSTGNIPAGIRVPVMEEFAFNFDNDRRGLCINVQHGIRIQRVYGVSGASCFVSTIGLLWFTHVERANLLVPGIEALAVGQDWELWGSRCQFKYV